MKTVSPEYTIPSRTVILNRLNHMYDFVKKEIVSVLKNFPFVSITTDAWSSLSTKSYMTITVHAIDKLYNLRSFTLDTTEMPESHTAINIHNRLSQSLKEWGIFDKVVKVVHDNAANMVAAIMQLDSSEYPKLAESVRCFSHTLQCAVTIALKEQNIADYLHKVSAIVGHFKHSNIATDALTTAQKELQLPTHRLITYCVTWWNSAYDMIERVIEQRLAIEMVLNNRSVTSLEAQRKLSLRSRDWTYLEHIARILKPFNVATKLMNSETNSTIGMVRPIIRSIISNFLQVDDQDSESISQLKEAFEEQLQNRFLKEQSPELFGIACFLDPRYKDLKEESVEYRSDMKKRVLDLIQQDGAVTGQSCSNDNQRARDLDFLFNPTSLSQNFERSITKYKAEAVILKADNPLVWWGSKKHKFPFLAKLAKKYLYIPAASTPSERVFSTAGNVISPKRSCLSSQSANLLIFLYQNREISYKYN
ncbi:GSCOCG00012873001-RA-CDS [Cotesia congregata]|nr:GSCOCG00012873001-RA-CDS [Cotesia congregata]